MKLPFRAVLACSSAIVLVACTSAPDEEVAKDEAPLVSDAKSMVQRPDGDWDVVCKNGTREIVTTAQILANDVCGGEEPFRCVRNCAERWSDGTCKRWAADYCAPGATCIAHVNVRWSDGSPKSYATDFCFAGPAKCISNCSVRWSDGSCKEYAADHCKGGPIPPKCVVRCVEHWSDGTCRTYGADVCN